jgi:23S rRNA pseudouridine2605 synthase
MRVDINKDEICIDGSPVVQATFRYLMLNKPRGLVTTARDEQGRDTVYGCLPAGLREWLAPVGRLDKASEGLLLFTNDTAWAHRVLDPAAHLPRVYHVQIDRKLSDYEISRLITGVSDASGERLHAMAVDVLREGSRNCWLAVTLTEGRNRQIRRMLATLDAGVLRLVRVAIGMVELGTLGKGLTRELTAAEIRALDG